MALDDDDMTTPPVEPDSGTPADRAAGSMSENEYLGRDEGADEGADGGADSGTDGVADGGADGGTGDGAGADDPTTEGDEDSRFA